MKPPLRRTSLVTQTAEVLREAIAEGQWSRWLPGELELTRRLHVSRVTLRAALAELEHEKLIRGGQGRRREIIHRSQTRQMHTRSETVVLLSPAPLHQLPARTVFWMDKLREHLAAAGWPLEVHESAATYRRRPAHALEELAARIHPAGWVLYRSTPEMQQWFSENARSAVIAGSRHSGVALSSVDVDYTAGCRHAGGQFSAAGHRRLAIIRPDTNLAGDLESVAGFRSGATHAEVREVIHDGSVQGICKSLDSLFAKASQPTGLFVFQGAYLLTVLGWLQLRGIRVPGDVSVACRDDDPVFEFVLPSPARYAVDAALFARKISRLVAGLVSGGRAQPHAHRMLPNFVRGETMGKATT